MTKLRTTFVAATLMAATWASTGTASAAAKAIVLVYGALAEGSGWRAVYDILKHDGYEVSIVQEPLTTI